VGGLSRYHERGGERLCKTMSGSRHVGATALRAVLRAPVASITQPALRTVVALPRSDARAVESRTAPGVGFAASALRCARPRCPPPLHPLNPNTGSRPTPRERRSPGFQGWNDGQAPNGRSRRAGCFGDALRVKCGRLQSMRVLPSTNHGMNLHVSFTGSCGMESTHICGGVCEV
jgi:hypothetical protein